MQIFEDEVHVWHSFLSLTALQLDRMMSYLSPLEVERTVNFHFQKDRDRYIASHGILREIIGGYIDKNPECLSFTRNAFGKPFLSSDDNPIGLLFNLSHSYDLAVFAFTLKRRIGIDVELIKTEAVRDRTIEYVFSPREVAGLRNLPAELQTAAFFNCWTRKEAFIKAKGEGLSIPLNQFDVSFVPGEPACLLRVGWDNGEAKRWRLHDLSVSREHAGAVAVEGHDWKLKCFNWSYWEIRCGHRSCGPYYPVGSQPNDGD